MASGRRHQRGSVAALAAALAVACAVVGLWTVAAPAGAAPLPPLTNDLKLGDAAPVTDLATVPGLAAPGGLGLASGLPTATETSVFAAGRVAVSIIFPQDTARAGNESWATTDSYGTAGLSSPYNPQLTPREAYIVGQIRKALDWWQNQAPAAAHLTFVIPTKPATGAKPTDGFPRQVSVGRQPINVASTNDQTWRHPIMTKLGFKAASGADSPPPETAYDNAVRKANHTDWAFTVYVVDSLNDHDKTPGAFPNGAFAYTFALFGPYTVTTYDDATYTPANFDGVIAHEIGHEFGALDEYKPTAPGYPSTGSFYSGYLWVQNSNAVQGGTTNDPCIMRGGQAGLDAYHDSSTLPDGGICAATRGQVGWVLARNGIPKVVDTKPTITLQPPVSADGATATVAGVAREVAWPPGHNAKGRAFSRGISIFRPDDLTYSVDGGATEPIASITRSGAKASFSAVVDISSLTAGRHLLAVQATTGTTASKSEVVWGPQTPVTLGLSAGSATIGLGGTVRMTVTARDGADPIAALPVTVAPERGATPAAKTVTTGGAGQTAVAFAPRFTTTFAAAFTPTPAAGTAEFQAATSAAVTVAVRAALIAHAAAPTAAGVVAVTGLFRPLRAGVPLVLQRLSGGAWTTVAHARTTSSSAFRLVYGAPSGSLRLRVRFVGDARNAATTKALPVVAVP